MRSHADDNLLPSLNPASPDKSQPHPDQETIDAWQTDAAEKDKLKVREQEVEETLARKRSRATHLIGWLPYIGKKRTSSSSIDSRTKSGWRMSI
ncbi:hypothetical protein [Luteolibacter luteus]|uniref:Uncharacterized protein n=1 Tax=Luteolibacter luteus TaxID=2728835 RepID=A0A858RC22_9BACT|nr:hypothetical protein [Luteolibacter luteus]QJE94235.1 hypothetical protein HHL09_00030 [Luteolibacter luteus]